MRNMTGVELLLVDGRRAKKNLLPLLTEIRHKSD